MSLLERTVLSLIRESRNKRARHIEQHLSHYESWEQLHLLKQLLCIRPAQPPLPPTLLEDIDNILIHSQRQRIYTRCTSVPTKAALNRPGQPEVRLRLWQGDITTLAGDVTAITNAANAQMLGCFQPTHKCIDNVIHSFAGPRLRRECFDIMETRASGVADTGEAIVTKGYCLPSPYVIHTVGPHLHRGTDPTNEEMQQLRRCYVAVLDKADCLPASSDGSKRVALCGIATGLFAFPTSLAAQIAVHAVTGWFAHKKDASITDVVFVTFAEGDYDIYTQELSKLQEPWRLLDPRPPSESLEIEGGTLAIAREWITSSNNIVVSAGAGFSAADGLDYTSKTLFKKNFHSFTKMGLSTLYSAIGFEFPSEEEKWAYFFTNMKMVRSWGSWDLYQCLVPWLNASGKDVHIRTSNADGLFLMSGWNESRLSTPQGRYSVLQCLAKCRPDSIFDSQPFYEAAQPYLDPITQRLTDPSKVPRCKNCGGEMMLCVRGGDWFNDIPFRDGEARWRKFRQDILKLEKQTVILELGVGMNTPGVLRWPNEDLVRKGGGKVKLVRVGLGPPAAVPTDSEADGLAVSIEGDIKSAIMWMLGSGREISQGARN